MGVVAGFLGRRIFFILGVYSVYVAILALFISIFFYYPIARHPTDSANKKRTLPAGVALGICIGLVLQF
jgi:hypothetical protein